MLTWWYVHQWSPFGREAGSPYRTWGGRGGAHNGATGFARVQCLYLLVLLLLMLVGDCTSWCQGHFFAKQMHTMVTLCTMATLLWPLCYFMPCWWCWPTIIISSVESWRDLKDVVMQKVVGMGGADSVSCRMMLNYSKLYVPRYLILVALHGALYAIILHCYIAFLL